MMWKSAAVLIVAVLVLIALHMKGAPPAYFVCSGVMTENVTYEQERVQQASLEVDVYPALNRLLIQPKERGSVVLSADVHYRFDLISESDTNIMFRRDEGFGMFNRVSRHLRANTGEVEYDLVCRETTPAKV